MRCSLGNPTYVVLLSFGTILLIPVWAGIVIAMIIFQADMQNDERQPRWPVMASYVLVHAQLKVTVAMAVDSLRDHPGWMLAVLLVASTGEFIIVAGMQPHQHQTLNVYRTLGASFAIWSCFCAFVALWIDDRTSVASMLLVCGGYPVVVGLIMHPLSFRWICSCSRSLAHRFAACIKSVKLTACDGSWSWPAARGTAEELTKSARVANLIEQLKAEGYGNLLREQDDPLHDDVLMSEPEPEVELDCIPSPYTQEFSAYAADQENTEEASICGVTRPGTPDAATTPS